MICGKATTARLTERVTFFPVHAGKIYFVTHGGSKPEVSSFSFIPNASRMAVSVPDVTLCTRKDATAYRHL